MPNNSSESMIEKAEGNKWNTLKGCGLGIFLLLPTISLTHDFNRVDPDLFEYTKNQIYVLIDLFLLPKHWVYSSEFTS